MFISKRELLNLKIMGQVVEIRTDICELLLKERLDIKTVKCQCSENQYIQNDREDIHLHLSEQLPLDQYSA